ncbi:hypothetical protein H6F67_00365 [Microcoleus sp. FACHB-1515]|uniref:hypothetical protein n=1 Tax=Cyanophyceae TaxID=3028117 RepID=UPI0016876C6E|nr:hypothetical protein [Microcoleus sp. FACHB-1515]MBD2088329.1 hypothetical protein [Microcoleus sp. FACHB-1515]
MKIKTKKDWAVLGGSVSVLCAGSFLFGIWASNTGNLSRMLFALGLGAGSTAAVATMRDRSAELTQATIDLKAELDREYRDKQQTVEAALKAQKEVQTLQSRVVKLENDLVISVRLNQQQDGDNQALQSQVADLQAKIATQLATIAAIERKLNDSDRCHLSHYKKDWALKASENVERVKAIQANKWYAQAQQNITENVGRYQARIDELNQEIERLTSEIDRLHHKLTEADQSLESFEKVTIPKIDQIYNNGIDEVCTSLDDYKRMYAIAQQNILELKKPLHFTGNTEAVKRANKIIDYLWNTQEYRCDRVEIKEGRSEDVIWLFFHNLNEHSANYKQVLNSETIKNEIQAELRLKSFPAFGFDADRWMLHCTIQHSAKERTSKEDIKKLWKSSEQFLEIAGEWQRIRITGGSESGKSPTARNVIYAMLVARSGQVKLYDPQSNSVKNHWSIEAIGKSHSESTKGLAELASLMDQDVVDDDIYVFDEIDSTIEVDSSTTKSIKAIVKQASHKTIRCAFIGQNANASNYRGMQRTDFNNVVNLHIGSNVYDAITNSNLSQKTKDKLTQIADKLTEYCSAQNDELGKMATGQDADVDAYRFAIVMEPQKLPYFIELPDFGKYRIKDILRDNTESNSTASQAARAAIDGSNAGNADSAVAASTAQVAPNADSTVAAALPVTPFFGANCIGCKTGRYTKTKSSRGVKYYTCNACGKSKSENVLSQYFGDEN